MNKDNAHPFDRYVESAERIGDIVAQAPPDDPVGMAMDRAAHVLAQAGLTVGDLLDELPQIRDRVAREAYGDTFMDELGREYAALHKQESGAGDLVSLDLGCKCSRKSRGVAIRSPVRAATS